MVSDSSAWTFSQRAIRWPEVLPQIRTSSWKFEAALLSNASSTTRLCCFVCFIVSQENRLMVAAVTDTFKSVLDRTRYRYLQLCDGISYHILPSSANAETSAGFVPPSGLLGVELHGRIAQIIPRTSRSRRCPAKPLQVSASQQRFLCHWSFSKCQNSEYRAGPGFFWLRCPPQQTRSFSMTVSMSNVAAKDLPHAHPASKCYLERPRHRECDRPRSPARLGAGSWNRNGAHND